MSNLQKKIKEINTVNKDFFFRSREMGQHIKIFAAKSDNLSLIPRIYVVEQNQLLQLVVWPPNMLLYMCANILT